jgi:NAD(P)H-hydrate epimerase
MQKVLTAEEMREVDHLTTEKYGIPSIILMENAAHAAARVITEKLGGSVEGKSFLILCGKGNNGGDGAALARILWSLGAKVNVYQVGKVEETKGDARLNFESVKKIAATGELYFEDDVLIDYWFHTSGFEVDKHDVLIDALFGTGLTRPLDLTFANFGNLYSYFKDVDRPIFLSLDLPSGLDSNRSLPIGTNFNSDITVTFTAPKPANVLPPASNFNGELFVAKIGSPQELIDNSSSKLFLSEKLDARAWIARTKFSSDSYKNKRGHALLIAGSRDYSGAAVLAGNAAMVSGVGLTTIVTSASAQPIVAEKTLEEIIVRGLAENEQGAIAESSYSEIDKLIEKVDVIGIGSGLGINGGSPRVSKGVKPRIEGNLVDKIIKNRRTPVVIDADGLNAMSPFDLKGSDEFPLILTPHEGEFLRLLGTNDKDAIKDRVKAVRDFSEKHQLILVLKGERVLIGAPDGRVVVNPTGNSGLGKAGNGDTLTGIITGFIAQAVQMNVDIFETVVAAVYCAGLAGDIAEKKLGKRAMLASDVRDCLVEAIREIES